MTRVTCLHPGGWERPAPLTPAGAVADAIGLVGLDWRGGTSSVAGPDPSGTVVQDRTHKERYQMAFILWIIAVVLVVWGIVTLVRGQALMGIVLIIVGLLVGPGGVSLFT